MKGAKIMALVNRKSNKIKPTSASQLTAEEKFWKEVEEHSANLMANLIEKTLPISATPKNFDPEKDADYRVLLREDLPNYYAEQEDYQEKIAQQNWTTQDVEYVSQHLICAYFDLVVQALADWLSEYPAFETTNLALLKEQYA